MGQEERHVFEGGFGGGIIEISGEESQPPIEKKVVIDEQGRSIEIKEEDIPEYLRKALNPRKSKTILDKTVNFTDENWRKKGKERQKQNGPKKIDGTKKITLRDGYVGQGKTEEPTELITKIPKEAIKIPEKAVETPTEARIRAIEETVDTSKKEVLELIKTLPEVQKRRKELKYEQASVSGNLEKLKEKFTEDVKNNKNIKDAEFSIGGKFLALREYLDKLKERRSELAKTVRGEKNLESDIWKDAKKELDIIVESQEIIGGLVEEIKKAAGVDEYIKKSMKELGKLENKQ